MATAAAVEKILPIRVDTTLKSLRSSGYSLEAAVGEPIDNALEARANHIRIHLAEGTRTLRNKKKEEVFKVVEKIALGDDGDGMIEDVLRRCLVLGESTRYDNRKGMGRFGVGGTLGAISQARRIEVYSRTKPSGSYLYSYLDLDEISDGKQEYMPEPESRDIPKEFTALLDPKSPGTLVVWSKCDRLTEGPSAAGKALKAKEIRTLDRVRTDLMKWIAQTYRYFLTSGITIEVNGTPVAPHDPLYLADSRFTGDPKASLEFEKILDWPVPTDPDTTAPIRIRMTLLPEEWRPIRGAGRETTFNRERRVVDNEPLSIVRANREIFFDIIPRFYPDGVREIARWIGIEITFDPVLDEAFQVRNVKRGVEPVDDLRHELRKIIQPVMETLVERVRKHWRANANVLKTKQGVHHAAEEIAAETEQTSLKVRAGRDIPAADREKKLDELAQKAAQTVTTPGEEGAPAQPTEQTIAAFRQRFRAMPFSIIDDHWPGNEFFSTEHLGENTIVTYNNRHPFFAKIYSRVLAAAGLHNDESETKSSLTPEKLAELAQVVQVGLDLLIVAYAKAEAMDDPRTEVEREQRKQIYDTLRTQWGLFLSQMVQRVPEADL